MSHLPTGEEDEEYVNPFCVEQARSGRSNCTRCKTAIGKGTLRVGQTKTTPESSMFGRTFWRHLSCVNGGIIQSVKERLVTITAADGWAALRKSDKALVLRVFDGDAAALAEAAAAERAALDAADKPAAGKVDKAEKKKKKAEALKAAPEAAAAEAPGGDARRASAEFVGADGGVADDKPKVKKAKKKLAL
jgi:hypothetical protein